MKDLSINNKKAELPPREAARLSIETRGFPPPFLNGFGLVSFVLIDGVVKTFHRLSYLEFKVFTRLP